MSASLKEDGWVAWMEDRHREAFPISVLPGGPLPPWLKLSKHGRVIANPDYKYPRPYWKRPNRWEETEDVG